MLAGDGGGTAVDVVQERLQVIARRLRMALPREQFGQQPDRFGLSPALDMLFKMVGCGDCFSQLHQSFAMCE